MSSDDIDLYGDLYADSEEAVTPVIEHEEPEQVSTTTSLPAPLPSSAGSLPTPALASSSSLPSSAVTTSTHGHNDQQQQQQQQHQQQQSVSSYGNNNSSGSHGASSVADEAKMFIGGLNWETTDDGLRTYFGQFGTVIQSNIMRDIETGQSRGFGFLTFESSASVNAVMMKQHILDGKSIDPKRAIPRSDGVVAAKSDKLFVRSIPNECTQESFGAFWSQFGNVTDATLMMDKESGRHRGFGFVNYESLESVEKVLNGGPLIMDGQLLEVKRAQAKNEPRRPDYGQSTSGAMNHFQQRPNNNMMNMNNNNHNNSNYGNPYNNNNFQQQQQQQQQNMMMQNPMMMGMINNNNNNSGNPAFDAQQMAAFFQQQNWQQWNPMMMMGGAGPAGAMAMQGAGGAGAVGGGVPGMMNPMMMNAAMMNYGGAAPGGLNYGMMGAGVGAGAGVGPGAAIGVGAIAGTAGGGNETYDMPSGPSNRGGGMMRGGAMMRGGMRGGGSMRGGGNFAAPSGPSAMRGDGAAGAGTEEDAGGVGPTRARAGAGGNSYRPY